MDANFTTMVVNFENILGGGDLGDTVNDIVSALGKAIFDKVSSLFSRPFFLCFSGSLMPHYLIDAGFSLLRLFACCFSFVVFAHALHVLERCGRSGGRSISSSREAFP